MSHYLWIIKYAFLDCKQVRHLFTIKMVLTALYCIIEAIDLFYFKIPGHKNADFYSQLWPFIVTQKILTHNLWLLLVDLNEKPFYKLTSAFLVGLSSTSLFLAYFERNSSSGIFSVRAYTILEIAVPWIFGLERSMILQWYRNSYFSSN